MLTRPFLATGHAADVICVHAPSYSQAHTSAPNAVATPSASSTLAAPEASVSSPALPDTASPAPASKAENVEAASTSAAGAADAKEDIGPIPTDPEGIINMEIFGQIQDMDDDDEDDAGGHEFSKGIVWGYFEQAENTFKQMEEAM